MKAIAVALTISVSVGLVLGAWVSREYWGYFFLRPTTPAALRSAVALRSVTPVKPLGERVACTLQADPEYSVQQRLQWAAEDPYYAHEGRLLEHLVARGLDPVRAPRNEPLQVQAIHQQLRAKGVLVGGEPGYDNATCLSGAAVEVVDEQGRVALVAGLRGQQVSNDHYPYYEATFLPTAEHGWRLSSSQRYFYDVAGIEGAEWPWLHGFFALAVQAAIAALALIYSASRARTPQNNALQLTKPAQAKELRS